MMSLVLTSCDNGVAYAGEALTEEVFMEESVETSFLEESVDTGNPEETVVEDTKETVAPGTVTEDPLQEESDARQPAEVPAETEKAEEETSSQTEPVMETGTEAGTEDSSPAAQSDQIEETDEMKTSAQTASPDLTGSADEAVSEKTTEGTSPQDGGGSETEEAGKKSGTETETDPEPVEEPDVEEDDFQEIETDLADEESTETEEMTDAISEVEDFLEDTEPDLEMELIEEETEDLLELEEEELTEVETEEEEPAARQYARINVGQTDYSGSGYFWDDSWFISPDFRFTQVEKAYALVAKGSGVFVYEKEDESAEKVGVIPYGSVVCILKELTNGWDYIESGDIRGFVNAAALTKNHSAGELVDLVGERNLTQGRLLCEKADNEAFTYTKTTSYPVIAKKVYAISEEPSWIYEYPDETSRFVGDVGNGSLVYLLTEESNGWYFIESGDVRGFIPEEVLLTGKKAEKLVKNMGEENAPLAEQLINPEENRSIYYTLRSVKSAGNGIGTQICKAAAGLVGKLPYVYGGTSLTAGADCSGFTQAVFSSYGITLPRTAQEQGNNGQAVLSLEQAQPGDIVYYASGPHVGIYMGGGKVVECSGNESNTASNPGKGPMVREADYMPITSIRRYLIVREESSSDGGYRTDDTPYTQEQLETIWAVVAQEDNGSYDGALAVISSAMNRTESGAWSYEGSNAYAQLTAAGQYCYSMDNYWVSRLHGNVPDYVKQAVDDCLRRGIRNHNYTSFRSSAGKTTGSGAVRIGGNWYFGS